MSETMMERVRETMTERVREKACGRVGDDEGVGEGKAWETIPKKLRGR